MRLVLSGGGTGGHVYPALSVAEALASELPPGKTLDLLYLGSPRGAESQLVERISISFRGVNSAPIRGRLPWQMGGNVLKMGRGVMEARRALTEFGAEVVLSTGGYVSFPVALAARSRNIPFVVYLPDLYPGWAVRTIARLARRVAVTAPEALHRLPDSKGIVTGYPVRSTFWQVNREEGRKRLGLDQEGKVLFVSGASQGARSINQAVAESLPALLELCEVVHLSGEADEGWLAQSRAGLPDCLRERYHLFGYMHDDTPWAMAAADLALCRSGASVMGELPAVGLPGVLVPYPYAGGHQSHNARYLAENGAAMVLEDRKLSSFLPLVRSLLEDETRLSAMREASRRLARADAASRIAQILIDLSRR